MTALGLVRFHPDPLADQANTRARGRWVASVAIAAALHAAVGATLPRARLEQPRLSSSGVLEVIEVAPPQPPAPVAESEPEPKPAQAAAPLRQPERRPSESAPAPAEAGQVVTREADPNEPVDLTDALVTGSGAVYAGGTTSASGVQKRAVRSHEIGSQVRGADGRLHPPISGPDQSRRPSLVGGLAWNCPFPSQADAEGIDRAVVTIHVLVGANAQVRTVGVVRDPGHGFGAAARRCALARRWQPALDRDGRPIAASVTLNVRFVR
jgi:periplasmic protein TonB